MKHVNFSMVAKLVKVPVKFFDGTEIEHRVWQQVYESAWRADCVSHITQLQRIDNHNQEMNVYRIFTSNMEEDVFMPRIVKED